MSTSGATRAGEIDIKSIYLIPSDHSSKTDISALMIETNIYEDIFSHTLSGCMTINDGLGFRSNLPMIGEEFIYMEYSSPLNPDKILKNIFFVFKVSDVKVFDKFENYTLHFVSVCGSEDLTTKTSQAYSGTADSIINSVFKTNFGFSDKQVKIESSSNKLKFVSNFWSPFKIINYATANALDNSVNPLPSFLFYEDVESYNFVSLKTLFSKSPTTEYFFDSTNPLRKDGGNGSSRDLEAEYKKIKTLYIDHHSDFIKRLMDGVYKSKVYEYNLLARTLVKHEFDRFKNFKNIPHLDKNPVQSSNERTGMGVIDFKVTYPYLHDEVKLDRAAFVLANRPGLLGASNIFSVDIVVHGRTDIKVGQTVNINFLQYESKDKTDKAKKQLDPYLSGKYLISAIQHRITPNSHEMVCQLFKDSYASAIDFDRKAT